LSASSQLGFYLRDAGASRAYNLEKTQAAGWLVLGGIVSIVFGIVLIAAPRFAPWW